jgi:hypothetical protein
MTNQWDMRPCTIFHDILMITIQWDVGEQNNEPLNNDKQPMGHGRAHLWNSYNGKKYEAHEIMPHYPWFFYPTF